MKPFKNIELKLVSGLIAAILWVMVTGKEYRYGDFKIPIEITNLPEGLVISSYGSPDGSPIKTCIVRVRANETVIRSLDERSMYLHVDLSEVGVGHHTFAFNERPGRETSTPSVASHMPQSQPGRRPRAPRSRRTPYPHVVL